MGKPFGRRLDFLGICLIFIHGDHLPQQTPRDAKVDSDSDHRGSETTRLYETLPKLKFASENFP